MKQEAEAAAAEAARQKAEAEKATAEAVAQQQALAAETDKARQAAAQSDALRQQAEKDRQRAENEKQELRARLLQQLNSILATRDSARGLVANMSDVLFRSGSFELLPGARERLAKVSGIVLAYPSLHVAIEGHTDSVGSTNTTSSSRNAALKPSAITSCSRALIRAPLKPTATARPNRSLRTTLPMGGSKIAGWS